MKTTRHFGDCDGTECPCRNADADDCCCCWPRREVVTVVATTCLTQQSLKR